MPKRATTRAFVEAYFRSAFDECEEVLGSLPASSPERPHCEAILLMTMTSDWRNRPANPDDAIARLKGVQGSPPGDLALFRAELMAAVRLFGQQRRVGEGLRCLRLLKQISETGAPALVRANVLHCEAAMAYVQGDMPAAREAFTKACALKVPAGCNLWHVLRLGLCLTAMDTGRWDQAERALAEVEARPPSDPGLRDMLALRRGRLFIIRGEPRKGLAFLDALPPPASAYAGWMRIAYRVRLLVIASRTRDAQVLLDTQGQALPEHEREFLQARIFLQGRNLEGVREHTRKSMIAGRRGTLPILDNASLLIAAELDAGHIEAARALLRMLDPTEALPSMSMSWAAIHFLGGRLADAARRFRRVLDVGDAAFLRENLSNSWGLSANQAAMLWRRAAELDPEEPGGRTAENAGTAPGQRPAPRAELVGNSPAMREVRARIDQYAGLSETVLVAGGTGTGKELVARLLHERSPRAARPFIAVNCAAISDTLIETELFGHVKGAFTGAESDHQGLFEAAGEGSIFLDEISSMSPRLQGTLLRVLENGEIRPVGANKPRRVSARVIAASNQPLDTLVARGEFRSDLYYRLARLKIDIPPLRERPEDIPTLVHHFLAGIYGANESVAGEGLLAELKSRPWPGNVRELKNEVERLVLLSGGQRVLSAEGAVPGTAAAAASPPAAAADPAAADSGGRRRVRDPLRTLREHFAREKELTRAEAVKLLGCAPNSATRYLKLLEEQGHIERVHTSKSLRTSYFVLKGQLGGTAPERTD
jgi:DNA-binding NtrC family response regulator